MLLLGGLVLAMAWPACLRQRWGLALCCLMMANLAFKTYCAGDLHLHAWDERYHALVARNMLSHPLTPTLYDRTPLPADPVDPQNDNHPFFWESAHVWLHKPPLALWLIAGSIKLFGISALAVRLPSLVLSTLAIGLTYLIGKKLFGPRVGITAAFFHCICGVLIAESAGRFATDHVDTTFIVLIELGIWFGLLHATGGRWIFSVLIGVTIGLALLTKWLPALIVLPVWLALAWPRQSKWRLVLAGATAVIVAGAICAPWHIYIHQHFPAEAAQESAYTFSHLTQGLEGNGHWFGYHIFKAGEFFGWLIYIPVICFIVTLRSKFTAPRLALAAWLLLPYIFFSLVATKMGGYVLISAPAIFLIEALFICEIIDWKAPPPWHKWKGAIVGAFVIAALIPCIDRLDLTHHHQKLDPSADTIRLLAQHGVDGNTILFNTDFPIEAMFYTNCIAYHREPTLQDVQTCQQQGFKVMVCKGIHKPLPDEIAHNPSIVLLPPQIDESLQGFKKR